MTKGPALADWLQKEILPQWNVDEHAERIHLGRQYIKENLSLTRFNSSIDEIIEKLKVR